MGQKNIRFSLFLFIANELKIHTGLRNLFSFLIKLRKKNDVNFYQQTLVDEKLGITQLNDQHLV
jgi:hypothetical protein